MDSGTEKQREFSFYFLKWVLITLIFVFVITLATKPLRKIWANNYIERGDEYLLQKKYASATLAYRKSLFLYWKNDEAKQRIALSNKSALDVITLKNFYQEKNVWSQTDLMSQAIALPDSEVDAIKLSKSLIEKGEYQYAILPALNGTEMDQTYRDAWLYLGIANFEVAQNIEMDNSTRNVYINEAKRALNKASIIDPEYQPTKDYLEAIAKL